MVGCLKIFRSLLRIRGRKRLNPNTHYIRWRNAFKLRKLPVTNKTKSGYRGDLIVFASNYDSQGDTSDAIRYFSSVRFVQRGVV